jgi:hypothetical protein
MGASLSEKDTKDVECFVAGWGYREEGHASSLPSILQGRINIYKKIIEIMTKRYGCKYPRKRNL